jgi:hypothetical protein
MKKQMFRVVCLLGVFISLSGAWANAAELKKEYHEEFDANENTVLNLKNQYGNIDVRNWDQSKVKIDVQVEVKHSNDERAERMLDYIDVKFSSDGNSITAETVIDSKFNRSNNWNNGNDFEINYTVMMPASINLDLSNKYGHVIIEEVAGHADITLKYGKLTVSKLSRGNVKPLNTVSLGYASGSSIAECNWLKANIKYSSLDIEKAKAIVAYTSYMKLKIAEVSSVVIEGKYDGYTFGKISNLVVKSSYSGIKAEELSQKLEAETKYTNASIGYMPADFELINISTSYGTYKIGLDEDASYEMEGEASYGKIQYHDSGKISRIQENNSMTVYGKVGNASSPSAEVKVSTKYGNVKLNEE